jgi:hypothetical protein
VKKFVGSCDICAQTKNRYHRLHGLLQPLLILASSRFSISMNFIINLPPSNSYDSILVAVVDHLTKMAHIIPYTKTITSKRTTKLFLDHVFQYHGLPKDIIIDCEPQFAFKFRK